MQQSHLRGVLSGRAAEASATPIVPAQRAPFASTRPNNPYLHGGSRLRAAGGAQARNVLPEAPAYGLYELRGDLERFVFLLGGSDGEQLFGP